MSQCLPYQGCLLKKSGKFQLVSALLLASMLSACGGGSSNDDSSDTDTIQNDELACNIDNQKQWAYDSLLDYYLFYNEVVPDANLRDYGSTSDVVTNLRYQARDPYSSVTNAASSTLLFDEGRNFGLGAAFSLDASGTPRIIFTYDDSPAGRAGIERGDIIIGINDILWSNLQLSAEQVNGTPENPATTNWQIQKNNTGEIITVTLTATEYQINTVALADVFAHPNGQDKIGYLSFNLFLETSEAELNNAFIRFQNENIRELILDLRYNGGGRVSIAQQLASQIAGDALANNILYQYRANDKYADRNQNLLFEATGFNMNLPRVVILTSPNTASSSEIVIAGLQPYAEVVTIGGTTNGKPYVSSGNDRCGERLNLMFAEGFNAENFSVYGGIEPTCLATDDLSRNFGLNANGEYEGMLKAGIDYIVDGSCAAVPFANASRTSDTAAVAEPDAIYDFAGMPLPGGALLD